MDDGEHQSTPGWFMGSDVTAREVPREYAELFTRSSRIERPAIEA